MLEGINCVMQIAREGESIIHDGIKRKMDNRDLPFCHQIVKRSAIHLEFLG